ncbi:uncharacterized protein F4822DRAFT_418921 [Hypoxylon trugodes]|uniref:uncharacterized protein n=1 Tax=Hypoxylon trugodes TaxID=326681 RepID=UPI0021998531|nr:uncharacterized protein F4822DRAFT_418921 [Hypoxylon trugodes]KAI1384172.1 hypothetical protein F4822DRAFT_418921 [Hypoxylon trugodes]
MLSSVCNLLFSFATVVVGPLGTDSLDVTRLPTSGPIYARKDDASRRYLVTWDYGLGVGEAGRTVPLLLVGLGLASRLGGRWTR